MNPLSVAALIAFLLIAWLGAGVVDGREERRRQRALGTNASSVPRSRQELPEMNRQEVAGNRFSGSQARRSRMLSVGREGNIREADVVCRDCAWEGIGSRLSTGLARVDGSGTLLYAYRCPACAGFELSRKGKLLAFASRNLTNEGSTAATREDRRSGATGRL